MTAPAARDLEDARRQKLKAQIEDTARKGGALVFGVADASSFDAAPEGHRPEDLLPGARSVVVVGGAKPRSGDWASPNFRHLELSTTSDRVTAMAMKLAHLIERELGYYALVVPPGVDEGQQPFLSLSLAAELAGCGTPSLAGPVLHGEHGFVYLAALITTLPLPADGPPDMPVCPAPECIDMYEENGRTPCTAVCPANDGGCLDGRISDGRWVERTYDRARCTARSYNHWIPSFQKVLADTLDEPDADRRRMMINSTLFTRTLWSMTYSNISQGQCFECIRVCPVDARSRELK
ncbi:MAG: hypothetical protein AAF441_08915 [Pseudomonadota bacterium]